MTDVDKRQIRPPVANRIVITAGMAITTVLAGIAAAAAFTEQGPTSILGWFLGALSAVGLHITARSPRLGMRLAPGVVAVVSEVRTRHLRAADIDAFRLTNYTFPVRRWELAIVMDDGRVVRQPHFRSWFRASDDLSAVCSTLEEWRSGTGPTTPPPTGTGG